MLRVLTITLILFAAHISAAAAERPPLPQRKTGDLQTLQSQLEKEGKNKDAIGGKLEKAEKDLHATKKDLVAAGEAVRTQEKILIALRQRIADNKNDSQELQARLEKDYGSISELILTLARLRQTPPETLLLRPGAPLDTARAALLMKHMLESVSNSAAVLSANLNDLNRIHDELARDEALARESKATLDGRYAEIASLVKKRENLYKTLNRDYRNSVARSEKLAQEARNLQEFMTRIERENTAEDSNDSYRGKIRDPGVGNDSATMPIFGPVTVAYGEKDMIGALSKGITIEGQPKSVVVCPISGTVKFSGNFKDYGNIIIIEHKGGYHSLVIGLDEMSVVTGQKLDAGEPVGRLPAASSRGGPPALYYELRHKGQPVDPSGKIAALRS